MGNVLGLMLLPFFELFFQDYTHTSRCAVDDDMVIDLAIYHHQLL